MNELHSLFLLRSLRKTHTINFLESIKYQKAILMNFFVFEACLTRATSLTGMNSGPLAFQCFSNQGEEMSTAFPFPLNEPRK